MTDEDGWDPAVARPVDSLVRVAITHIYRCLVDQGDEEAAAEVREAAGTPCGAETAWKYVPRLSDEERELLPPNWRN